MCSAALKNTSVASVYLRSSAIFAHYFLLKKTGAFVQGSDRRRGPNKGKSSCHEIASFQISGSNHHKYAGGVMLSLFDEGPGFFFLLLG
jgi:hypothetical protein